MSVTIDEFVPLESGDRLTRAEFHRRYSARPDIAKAELIEGVVYVAAPVRAGVHGTPDSLIHWWLNGYAAGVPGLQVASNSTVVLGDQSEVQPDACLYWQPWTGAGSRLTDDGYLDGAPLLVAEVAASRSSYDLHDKLEAYRRAGVAGYVVWQVLEKRIVWFQLRDG